MDIHDRTGAALVDPGMVKSRGAAAIQRAGGTLEFDTGLSAALDTSAARRLPEENRRKEHILTKNCCGSGSVTLWFAPPETEP